MYVNFVTARMPNGTSSFRVIRRFRVEISRRAPRATCKTTELIDAPTFSRPMANERLKRTTTPPGAIHFRSKSCRTYVPYFRRWGELSLCFPYTLPTFDRNCRHPRPVPLRRARNNIYSGTRPARTPITTWTLLIVTDGAKLLRWPRILLSCRII